MYAHHRYLKTMKVIRRSSRWEEACYIRCEYVSKAFLENLIQDMQITTKTRK